MEFQSHTRLIAATRSWRSTLLTSTSKPDRSLRSSARQAAARPRFFVRLPGSRTPRPGRSPSAARQSAARARANDTGSNPKSATLGWCFKTVPSSPTSPLPRTSCSASAPCVKHCHGPRCSRASMNCSTWSTSRASATASPTRFPADSNSASPSLGRLLPSQRCSSSMSRSQHSTPPCASRSVLKLLASCATSASPPCSSPTTKMKRSYLVTESP